MYEVTVERSKGLPGWVAKVHPKGDPADWVYGVWHVSRRSAEDSANGWLHHWRMGL